MQRATQGAHLSGQDGAVEEVGRKNFDTLLGKPIVGVDNAY